ncbi:aldehyde dehydrogenase [Peristeroidobacter agariperforans]|uniref:aldehyde dehydrogenase n=1 Tax=Peristeroidobacter agariperforans TaxID=268404 RepID=UPI00101C2EA2|nr:aldehyde dehydrogenase [Peristeroidobacter agariperforans]
MRRYGHYIGGQETAPRSGSYLASENPYTGEAWAEVARGNADDVAAAVSAAKSAFANPAWCEITASRRAALLRKVADLIIEEAPRLAQIEQRDNGKLASEVNAQVRYVGEYFHYYAGLADKVQGHVVPNDKGGALTYIRYEAKGVVGIITPWNSPLTLTSWKLAPALAAGCTAVIKPSEFTSCAIVEFADLFRRAGFPDGVVNVVTGLGDEVGAPLVLHPDVAHIGFTGGEAAGVRVYELAARGLKTVTLELGGKSPNIIFEDADFDQALNGVFAGIFAASGQSCQAGSRLLLQRSIHDEFVERLAAFTKGLRLGDPTVAETQVGPIATRPQFEKILKYIDIAKAAGARCIAGGQARSDLGAGQFIEPTIFTNVDMRMRIAQEEVFGPVLCVIPFEDEADAVRIANDVAFGLAAAVWTKDVNRAMSMTAKLKAGTVWVNNYRATSFTAPFGGMKRSGLGRESGVDAIREYLDTKCVWIASAPARKSS